MHEFECINFQLNKDFYFTPYTFYMLCSLKYWQESNNIRQLGPNLAVQYMIATRYM